MTCTICETPAALDDLDLCPDCAAHEPLRNAVRFSRDQRKIRDDRDAANQAGSKE